MFVHQWNRNVDLREYLTEEAQISEKNTTYDLVANVVHDGKPNEGAYRIHVLHHVSCCIHLRCIFTLVSSVLLISSMSNQGTGKWYEMQDLQVIDILPQMITLSEAYIQASLLTQSHVANQKKHFVVIFTAGGYIDGPQLSAAVSQLRA